MGIPRLVTLNFRGVLLLLDAIKKERQTPWPKRMVHVYTIGRLTLCYLTKAEITKPSNLASAGSWTSVSNVTKKGTWLFWSLLGNFFNPRHRATEMMWCVFLKLIRTMYVLIEKTSLTNQSIRHNLQICRLVTLQLVFVSFRVFKLYFKLGNMRIFYF